MAYSEKLKSSRFSGVARNPITGERYRVKDENGRTFPTREAAQAAAEADEDRLRRQLTGVPEPTVPASPALADYGTRVLDKLDVERSSRATYHSAWRNQVTHYWGPAITVAEVTPYMVQEMLVEAMHRGIGNSRRNNLLMVIRKVMRAAVLEEHRIGDPTLGMKVKAPRRRYHHLLADDQLMYIGYLVPQWLWPALLISHDCGLRISEVCALKREHVNPLRSRLHVADIFEFDGVDRPYPKGKEIADLPLSNRLRDVLDEHLRTFGNYGGARTGYLFCDPADGRPLNPNRLRRWFKRARAQVGIEHASYHDLRHGCCQRLIDAGAPLQVPQAILRHKNPSTTALYVKNVQMEQLQEFTQAAFDGPREPVADAPVRVAR